MDANSPSVLQGHLTLWFDPERNANVFAFRGKNESSPEDTYVLDSGDNLMVFGHSINADEVRFDEPFRFEYVEPYTVLSEEAKKSVNINGIPSVVLCQKPLGELRGTGYYGEKNLYVWIWAFTTDRKAWLEVF